MRMTEMFLVSLFLTLIILSVTVNVEVTAFTHHSVTQSRDEPWNPQTMLLTIQSYVAWGSPDGQLMPDCEAFDAIFTGNKTWESPFVVPYGFAMIDIEKYCKELAQNITWHSGKLETGNVVYPLYYGQTDTKPYRVAFVWNAIGESSYREIFGLKQYDFTIVSTVQFYNETAIFTGKDIFWPQSQGDVPDVLMTMINQYISFMQGDCTKYLDLWDKYGYIQPSGSDGFYGTDNILSYCSKMMYEWSSYTYHLHDVTFSVFSYTGVINEVAFTWTRTGLHLGEVRTDEVMTELYLFQDNTPLKTLKISSSTEYFQPPFRPSRRFASKAEGE
ncbi:uncharacterized protein LOC134195699 [Corticium candelabrum]|uniref:uncharacterized protein LOC134195699 n=1 Tax=Corticium candelabrum TaxID=121492 RepID=UPI002E273BB1|nr:uncharacterized protein LOC134195699 [Corticium candelabrum]